MIVTLTRCSAPFYVQFELTQRCNNRCFFCYNDIGQVAGNELSTDEVKRILNEMAAAGVFRVNFNGGEPLLRSDFLDICCCARDIGLEIHMNTNATLVTKEVAERLSCLMPSVCTSLLSSNQATHDAMSGRVGSFQEALRGMDLLRDQGIRIEVNVCTTMDNYRDIYAIAQLASSHGCYALCATRYILTNASQSGLLLTADATLELIQLLERIEAEIEGIVDVSLPGPVPLCELPAHSRESVTRLNVPCQYGYGLCRISATGLITPCTISSDVLADLRKVSFPEAWNVSGWNKYVQLGHIPRHCHACEDFSACSGGCIVYDECLINNGVSPCTRKWTGVVL